MTRHIGGSLLPSSAPHILQRIPFASGALQVRALADLDTHALFHTHDRGESIVAMHPNGYSCRELAERIVQRDEKRIRDQAEYIQLCGGVTRHHDHIVAISLPD